MLTNVLMSIVVAVVTNITYEGGEVVEGWYENKLIYTPGQDIEMDVKEYRSPRYEVETVTERTTRRVKAFDMVTTSDKVLSIRKRRLRHVDRWEPDGEWVDWNIPEPVIWSTGFNTTSTGLIYRGDISMTNGLQIHKGE